MSNTQPGTSDGGKLQASALPGSIQPPQRDYTHIPQCDLTVDQLGTPVDEWTALIMGQASLADDDMLLLDVLDLVARRGIPDLCLDSDAAGIGTGEGNRDFVALRQPLLNNLETVVVLRVIAKTDLDLDVSWRLYVRNTSKIRKTDALSGCLKTTGFICFGIALLALVISVLVKGEGCTFATGLFLAMCGGVAFLAATRLSQRGPILYDLPASTGQGRDLGGNVDEYAMADASSLALIVHDCFMKALTAHRVELSDLRVLRQPTRVGIG